MDFFEKMSSVNFWWISIIVLIFFSALGLLIGAINGFKVSMYFLIWNLIALIPTIFIIKYIYEDVFYELIVDKLLGQDLKDEVGASAVDKTFNLLKGAFILLSIVASAIVMNLIALIFYLFFRRSLKGLMKANKRVGISNAPSRLFGATVGFISVLPIAVSISSVTTIVSNNKDVNHFNSGMAKVITLGNVDHISEDFDGIYAIVLMATYGTEDLKNLAEAITGQGTPSEETIRNMASTINRLLNNDKSNDIALDALAHIVEKNAPINNLDDATIVNSIDTGDIPAGVLDELSLLAVDRLKIIVKSIFDDSNVTDATIDKLVAHLTENNN